MIVSTFFEKLNKVDGNVYVIEEEIHLVNGAYEAELQHDNINEATFAVYTGPKLTGDRLETYTLSTPSLAPWKRIVRVYADVPVVYISYETDGDTVEADDINRAQAAIVETQEAVSAEEVRALGAEKILADDLQAEINRAGMEESRLDGRIDTESGRAQEAEQALRDGLAAETQRAKAAEKVNADDLVAEATRAKAAEKVLTDSLAAEGTRAKAAEKGLADAINAESDRAQAAEKVLQDNIDGHTDAVNLEIQSLRAADTDLEERKANATDVNRELGNRYTKDQVYTKAEVLKKIEDLIGAAPDTLDTFREIADALGNDPNFATTIMTALGGKVDKVAGKQLSSNDYTDAEKATLEDTNSKKHTHGNKSVLDKLTEILLGNWTDAYNKRHEHGNKSVIDKLTQAMLDKLDNIAAEAEVNVQSDWNVTDTRSDAYIKNKPTSMPASDVSAWAKASTKPSYAWTEIGSKPSAFPPSSHTHTNAQVGLGNVENKSGATIRSEMTKAEVVAALGYTPPETTIGYKHPDSGVIAGTYRSVTVNAQGHVTAGSNPALTWGDLKGV